MRHLDIDQEAVELCYRESFVVANDLESQNNLLEKDTAKAFDLGVYLHPGLTINDMTYRGYLEGSDIEDAICDSFNNKPAMCKGGFNAIFEDFFTFESRLDRKSRDWDEDRQRVG